MSIGGTMPRFYLPNWVQCCLQALSRHPENQDCTLDSYPTIQA